MTMSRLTSAATKRWHCWRIKIELLLPRKGLVYADGAINAGGGDSSPVGAELHGHGQSRVVLKRENLAACSNIPEFDGGIGEDAEVFRRHNDQPFSIGAERRVQHSGTRLPSRQAAARLGVPEANRASPASRGDGLAVRADRQGAEFGSTAHEREEVPARVRLPNVSFRIVQASYIVPRAPDP